MKKKHNTQATETATQVHTQSTQKSNTTSTTTTTTTIMLTRTNRTTTTTTHFIKTTTSKSSKTQTRNKTTSGQYVASRARDPTFEKLMDHYKNLNKVISIQDLILSTTVSDPLSSSRPPCPPAVSLEFLSWLSQKLHLNRGAASFLRKYPHIFEIYYDPVKSKPYCRLTDVALRLTRHESEAIASDLALVKERLVRVLAMSVSKTVPLRAVFKVWRELGLPDDFEDSVLLKNPKSFGLDEGNEPNTHFLKLLEEMPQRDFTAAVEDWRVKECCKENSGVDRTEIRFSFKHGYPPGMRLSKNFKAKVKEWQGLSYVGPYEDFCEEERKRKSRNAVMRSEKRAVAVAHEFLSLTVEKRVEVEKFSHFRKWFGIDLNVRDLFLDHPGIFYLSTKGKTHTVFLREAYERGRLIDPNPVYDIRRKLLDLVVLGRRGLFASRSSNGEIGLSEDNGMLRAENDDGN